MTKETPAQTIKRLEKENEDLRILNYINSETIDRVDQQTGSNYRKKFVTKLSEVNKNYRLYLHLNYSYKQILHYNPAQQQYTIHHLY